MEALIEQFGEARLMLISGIVIGLLFGYAAYSSKFCLRAATVEVAEGRLGPKLAIWLVAFFAALSSVQIAIAFDVLNVSDARQIAATGSISGAIIGGLLFGIGMVLARGCASRLLVLSASGNLRAIITGLVLTLFAQASLRGVLSPARESLASIWTIEGGTARQLLSIDLTSNPWLSLAFLAMPITAFIFGTMRGSRTSDLIFAAFVGISIYFGWQVTHHIAQSSFEIVAVQSVTFTGPSTDTLMGLVNERTSPASFGLGLVPGVFIGALLAALQKGEARIQRFEPDVPMERYLIGGSFMGFGSMLAGGCAVGAGMSGGSILALTAWIAVFCMWIGAMATHRILSARSGFQLA